MEKSKTHKTLETNTLFFYDVRGPGGSKMGPKGVKIGLRDKMPWKMQKKRLQEGSDGWQNVLSSIGWGSPPSARGVPDGGGA